MKSNYRNITRASVAGILSLAALVAGCDSADARSEKRQAAAILLVDDAATVDAVQLDLLVDGSFKLGRVNPIVVVIASHAVIVRDRHIDAVPGVDRVLSLEGSRFDTATPVWAWHNAADQGRCYSWPPDDRAPPGQAENGRCRAIRHPGEQ